MDTLICKAAAASLLGAALCGCADLRWHKEGADAAALERDQRECGLQAYAQARREAGMFTLDTPRVVGLDAQGRPVMGPSSRLGSERAMLELDLRRACMTKRGYKLLPVENPRRAQAQG